MWGGKDRSLSLQEGVSHTYIYLDYAKVEFLSCKKKKKKKKITSLTACQELHAATIEKPFALMHVFMSCRLPFPKWIWSIVKMKIHVNHQRRRRRRRRRRWWWEVQPLRFCGGQERREMRGERECDGQERWERMWEQIKGKIVIINE